MRGPSGAFPAHARADVDREGKLAANFEGNQFSAEQLGDFVETTLKHAR